MAYKILPEIFSLVEDTLSIIYPSLCASCDELLIKEENVICINCLMALPRTNFHLLSDNIIEKQFWGKVLIEKASAYFYFYKGEKVQTLMHRLKYESRPDIGIRIGQICGQDIKSISPYSDIDLIVSVPLHKRKFRTRGYNQSDAFAEGLSQAMGVKFSNDIIKRIKYTETQTKKSRLSRHDNVKAVFEIKKAKLLQIKHILLVDDVITTGSTLAACVALFNTIDGLKVSLLAIAYAEK